MALVNTPLTTLLSFLNGWMGMRSEQLKAVGLLAVIHVAASQHSCVRITLWTHPAWIHLGKEILTPVEDASECYIASTEESCCCVGDSRIRK